MQSYQLWVTPHSDHDSEQAHKACKYLGAQWLNLKELPQSFDGKNFVLEVGAQLSNLKWYDHQNLSLNIHFGVGSKAHRICHQSGKPALIRAILGRSKNQNPLNVIDATAGLGQDAYLIAHWGMRVTLCEKEPILAWMLQHALAAMNDGNEVMIVERMQVKSMNAIDLFQQVNDVDVIYLDPMFPVRQKPSLVKQDFQVMHALVGTAEKPEGLFHAAFNSQAKKIIVKRPFSAPPLGHKKPTYVIREKMIRYDVYLNATKTII